MILEIFYYMESLYIKGGKPLNGSLDIATSKNAILPILAGAIMTNKNVVLKNCTLYSDVLYMLKILGELGAEINIDDNNIIINSENANKYFVCDENTKKMRSSIFLLGPLLTRFKKAKVAYPGGCNIGTRPIDLHLKGLRMLNVKIIEMHGYIICDGKNMRAGEIHLDFPSVGATENLIMASIMLKGTTTISNVAKEPEIVDLQNFINSMGGDVRGAGGDTITINGVSSLHGCEYSPIKDRIICGTYLIACAMAGGEIKLNGSPAIHNLALLSKLKQSGCKLSYTADSIIICSKNKLKSIPKIETLPYPGFPTDLQNQILTMQTISKGTSVIVENLFETRFKIYTELTKMGADITINNKTAIIKGVTKLYGASLVASDLRGGAGLVLAGIVAEGHTIISDIYHIDRGYKNIENDLLKLNAEIKRIIN